MKKGTIGGGFKHEDAKTDKTYKKIIIKHSAVVEREEKSETRKVYPLNYFAGPHFLFLQIIFQNSTKAKNKN